MGFEPTTPGLEVRCAIRCATEAKRTWTRPWWDSNPQPLDPKSSALSIAPQGPRSESFEVSKTYQVDGNRFDMHKTFRQLRIQNPRGKKVGECGLRSRCLVVANDALYQLS